MTQLSKGTPVTSTLVTWTSSDSIWKEITQRIMEAGGLGAPRKLAIMYIISELTLVF